MKTETRTKNSIRNIVFAFIYYGIQLLASLCIRMIFVRYFLIEYLGINSLFSNVLLILSVAESGVGAAMTFALYKPMAEGNDEEVRQIIALYRKYYTVIGIVIALIGLIILPLLPYLIKDFNNIDLNLYVIFIIFLFNSVISYFTAPRKSLFYADQRNDLESKINILGIILTSICQILSILVFKNYYLYALANTINVLFINLMVIFVTNKKYKHLIKVPQNSLKEQKRKEIKKNVFALFYHRIGSIVLSGTDSLILSAFIGVAILGKYSNYLLITTSLNSVLSMFLTAIKGSVGNAINTLDTETNIKLFKKINYIYFWIISFFTTAFFVLANPFISLFFGTEYALDLSVVIIISINFFLFNARQIMYIFKECKGLFWQNRFSPILEAGINIILSIVLVKIMGISGVILGTIISGAILPLWNEPYIVNKYYFKKSNIKYMIKVLVYSIIAFISAGSTYFICSFIPDGSMLLLIAKFAICTIISNIVLLTCLCWMPEFKDSVNWIKCIIYNMKIRRSKKNEKTGDACGNMDENLKSIILEEEDK